VEFSDFINNIIDKGCEYVPDINYDKQTISLYLDDGSRMNFTFDEWFKIFETAIHVLSINSDLSQTN